MDIDRYEHLKQSILQHFNSACPCATSENGLSLTQFFELIDSFICDLTSQNKQLQEHELSLQQELTQSKILLHNLMNAIDDPIFLKDENFRYIGSNKAHQKLFGMKKDEIIGKTDFDFFERDQASHFRRMDKEMLAQNATHNKVEWIDYPGGEKQYLDTRKSPLNYAQNKIGIVGISRNITHLIEYQKQLKDIAYNDHLTGLPNRILLLDRLYQAMLLNLRQGSMLAIAFIDLDGFKQVNDCHGHHIGDALLIEVAKTMKEVVRESDSISRIGGDEFLAILSNVNGKEGCIKTIERLLASIRGITQIEDKKINISASIGISTYPQKVELDAEQFIDQADKAMYDAKNSGKDRFCFFKEIE